MKETQTANKTTQIAVVENTKLTELAQKSGIELTKAESHVSAFHPALAELSDLSRPLATLDKERAGDAMVARENRLKIVKIRTGSESIKDERKKVLLAESNLIQSAFNLVKDACILTESEYEEIEKHQERIEAKRRIDLKEARILILAQFGTDTEFLPLDIMDEEKFQALFAKEKEAFEAVKAKRKQDELDRIEAERLAEEAIKAEKEAEQERIRLQAIENERLQAKIAEQKKEAERLHVIVEAERVKTQKRIDELKAKQAAIELAEENERLAKIAEQEEKDAKAKAALLAPDKEKINALYISIRDFAFPECQTPEANQIIKDVREGMKAILTGIKMKSSHLIK